MSSSVGQHSTLLSDVNKSDVPFMNINYV